MNLSSSTKIIFLILMLYNLIYSKKSFCANDSISKHTIVAIDSTKVEVRKLKQETKENLLKNTDYRYDKVGPAPKTPWEMLIDWIDRMISKLFDTEGGKLSWSIFQYLLMFAAIAVIIILLFKNNIRSLFYGKSAPVSIDFSEIEEDIYKIDFQKLISEAIAKKDFRKAVRLHFLLLLKQLTDKNLIQWKIDKTNKDYSVELTNNRFNKQFKEITFLYEYFWYGNFPIDESKYQNTIEKFKAIKL